jgi:hypothetical protein
LINDYDAFDLHAILASDGRSEAVLNDTIHHGRDAESLPALAFAAPRAAVDWTP